MSAGSGGGLFKLGSKWPIEAIDRLIYLHFHFPITNLDVLQLLLAPIAPMWCRVGVLNFITYMRFNTLGYGVHYLDIL
jgi:hypothetical protein